MILKKFISVFLVAVLFASLLLGFSRPVRADSGNWSNYASNETLNVETSTTDGGATLYTIKTAQGLAWVASQVNSGKTYQGETVTLANDIVLSGHDWTPVGTSSTKCFKGVFKGNNKLISGLKIGSSDSANSDLYYAGLFGYTSGAVLSNVNLAGVAVYSSKPTAAVGGLVGYAVSSAITGCHAAGIVSDCGTGDILGGGVDSTDVGGLVGYASSTALTDSYAQCEVSGVTKGNYYAYVGGLVGLAQPCTITNCYAAGHATGEFSPCVGGLVGMMQTGTTVTNSYALGEVTGTSDPSDTKTYVGGLAGYADGVTVTNSYASGNVAGNNVDRVGGLLGFGNGTVTNGYWNGNATQSINGGLSSSNSGVGTGTASTSTIASYAMQDNSFVTALNSNVGNLGDSTLRTWKIVDGSNGNYPMLNGVGNIGTYTVTYDLNGGTGTVPVDSGIYQSGSSVATLDLTTSSHDMFVGWNTKADGTGTTYAVGAPFIITGYTTLYANWNTWQNYSSAPPQSGDTYTVSSAGQLAWVAGQVHSGNTFSGKIIVLAQDIDLAGRYWTPIGDNDYTFSGTFDGNKHQVSGLKIGAPGSENSGLVSAGLFGYINGAVIKNLQLKNVGIYSSKSYAYLGCLVGVAQNCTITGCSAAGEVKGCAPADIGGLVGLAGDLTGLGTNITVLAASDQCTITDSYADVNVTSGNGDYACLGGLVGSVYLSGLNRKVAVKNCYAAGNITGTANKYTNAGGLIGSLSVAHNAACLVANSYATGNAQGGIDYSNIGGLVGNVYNQYSPSSSPPDYSSTQITNCYAAGQATCGILNRAGGLFGISSYTALTNGYWNSIQNGVGIGISYYHSGPATGMTTGEMQSTDFTNTLNTNVNSVSDSSYKAWKTKSGDNGGYPFLVGVGDFETYTVTYNGNGSTGGAVPAVVLLSEGATTSVSGNTGLLAKTGYTFAGWNRAADGSGASCAPGSTLTMGTANVILYAQWTATAMELDTTALAEGTYHTAYSQAINAASGGSGSFSYAVTSASLPAGLTLSGTTISGTPTAAGTYTFTLTATDTLNALSANAAYTIVINKADQSIFGAMTYSKTFGDSDFALDSAAGTEVIYTLTSGGSFIDLTGNTVTIKGAGTATVTASAAADANYNAASDETITINIVVAGKPIAVNALAFDGVDDYVLIPDNDADISAFTLETWVKWEPTIPTDIQFLCGKGLEQMEIHTGGGANGLRFIPATGVYLDATNALPTGVWTHLAVVYDPSVALVKLYINGEEVTLTNNGTAPLTTAVGNTATLFSLGSRSDGTYPFKGAMDEFRIWNRVLTQGEILGDMVNALDVPAQTGLIDYYNFNQGIAGGNNAPLTNLPDLSGINNGTLINFALSSGTSNWVAGDAWAGVQTYTITYNSNGATTGTAPADSRQYPEGAAATVMGVAQLAKTGFIFSGWNTAADGSGTSCAAGATINLAAANLTLYAQWQVPTLSSLTLTGSIPNLTVGQAVYNLNNLDLSGRDQNGALFNLDGQSIQWNLATGSSKASLTDSTLTPVAAGSGTVTAIVYGVTSNALGFTVLTAPSPPATYSVTIGALTGGNITASPASATSGTAINLSITPENGKQLQAGTLKYNDGTQDHAISGTSFSMPAANVTVTVVFEAIPSPPITAPLLQSATTDGSGTRIILTFSKAMANPSSSAGAFSLSVSRSGAPLVESVTGVSLGSDSTQFILSLTQPLLADDSVQVSYTPGTLTGADGGVLSAINNQTVTNQAPRPVVVNNTPITVSAGQQNLAITLATVSDAGNNPLVVNVPSGVSNTTLNVVGLLQAPSSGTVTSSALPALTIAAAVDLNSNGSPPVNVQIQIPQGTTVSAPTGWDGTIQVPTVQAANSVTVTPSSGNTATVDSVIEVGFGNVPLTFTQAVRLLIPGQAGKKAGYVRNGMFTSISTLLNADNQTTADNTLVAGQDGYLNVGADLIIWTKHFTQFVTYTETPISNGGGGSDGGGSTSNSVSIGTLTGGSIIASPTSATVGTTITLIITPNAGMQLKAGSLKYNDGTTNHSISGTSFTMPAANVTVLGQFEPSAPIVVSVDGVSLNKTIISLIVGQTEQLTATITPANATFKTVTWSVSGQSGSNVVTLSPIGLVKAVNPGTAVIGVTGDVDPTKFAECSVTVASGDNTALVTAITNAKDLIGSKTIGTAGGNVSQQAHDAYNTAITSATIVKDNLAATQTEIDEAVTTLATATSTFNAAIVRKNSIISFVVPRQVGNAIIDSRNHTISFHLANGTSVTRIAPTITVSAGATISPKSKAGKNFTDPVIYTVIAQDGTSQTWTVMCIVDPKSSAKDIMDFKVAKQVGTSAIDATNHAISFHMKNGASVNRIAPTIALSAEATINPKSRVTKNFTAPVIYTVTAQDGTSETWTVTCIVDPKSSAKDITDFKVAKQVGTSAIDARNHTISFHMKNGASVNRIAPTIALSAEATINPKSRVTKNFTDPVIYTVTAQDGTSETWTVTCIVDP